MNIEKKWNEVYSYWLTLNVSNVKTIAFDINKHHVYSAWYDNKEKRQQYYSENPIKQTAFHLANYLKNKNTEVIATYKIYAILKYFEIYDFHKEINFAFAKHNEDSSGFWSANSKYLFPYFAEINDSDFRRNKVLKDDLKALVHVAAKFWNALAESLSIVIIPELMEYNSDEYHSYQNFLNQLENDKEYQQYLKLKAKFGK